MGRVALIGDNSPDYVSLILDIWNSGNSVVLLDKNIPYQRALAMMKEAEVAECMIEEKIYGAWGYTQDDHIKYNVYSSTCGKYSIVPEDVSSNFQSNYLNDEAIVIYSSGTTGQSRGVILSHFAINTNADAILEYMHLKKQDCLYIIKPLVHSSTLVGELLIGYN